MISQREIAFGLTGLFIGYAFQNKSYHQQKTEQKNTLLSQLVETMKPMNAWEGNAKVLLFYHNLWPIESTDLFLSSILNWNETQDFGPWETNHNFIQWIFPTNIPSNHQQHVPILVQPNIDKLIEDPIFLDRYAECFIKFMNFMKIDIQKQGQTILFVVTDGFSHKRSHNYLRMSRLINSLRCFAFDDVSTALYNALVKDIGLKPDFVKQSANFWARYAKAENIWTVQNNTEFFSLNFISKEQQKSLLWTRLWDKNLV